MKTVAWLLVIGVVAGLAYWLWRVRQAWIARTRAAEERFSSLMVSAQVPAAVPAAPRPDAAALATQKLLLDAAAKAGEASEPALSIQLYARLLSRYPETSFAGQARAAVEAQKKKIASARAPGTAGPG
jgi:cytoskeletal protein RodZ